MGGGVFFFAALIEVKNEPVQLVFLLQKPVLYARALMIQMRWLFTSRKAVSSVLVSACAAWKMLRNT